VLLRIIFIGDNIDEEFSNQVLASMLYLDSIDNAKKKLLYINGPGGDVRTLEYHIFIF
jgi:ATP-dependent Clp protease, protease subunit